MVINGFAFVYAALVEVALHSYSFWDHGNSVNGATGRKLASCTRLLAGTGGQVSAELLVRLPTSQTKSL